MARIPDADIERLKTDIDLAEVVRASGVDLQRAGKDWIGHCPFHDDKTPSLLITPKKNLWHCLGACQTGGTVIDWVMRRQGLAFREAVDRLRGQLPALAANSLPTDPVPVDVAQLPDFPLELEVTDADMLARVRDFYTQTLRDAPEGLAYLRARGLAHPELIEHFRLGYANRTLGLKLPEKNRKLGEALRLRLTRLGVLRESGHEHFAGSLVIPIHNEAGDVVGMYGRKLRDDLRKGTPLHLYLPGPHRGVWNLEGVTAGQGEVILCEALIDALTFWCAGFRNVTCAYGVAGFTEGHRQAFVRAGIKRVLIAYDRDEAGNRAAQQLAGELLAAGIGCWRVLFPLGMDANEYARKVTAPEQALGLVLEYAQWMGDGEGPLRRLPAAAASESVPAAVLEASPSLVAQPTSTPPATPALPGEPQLMAQGEDLHLVLGERRYRVRGAQKNQSLDQLKINLLAACGDGYYVDSFDLYSAKSRHHYIQAAARELSLREDVVKHDLGKLLFRLEAWQQARLEGELTPEPAAPVMSEAEREAALAWLQSPDLLGRILADFDAVGLAGEATNKLTAYLAILSRKLDSPLAVVVQSSSAAGKSSLMDAVLAFVPEEDRLKYSAMTGQSLYYLGQTGLKHKILAICEEEGAARASYALKVLQSDGELTIASTGKDPHSGNLVTQEYRVEGPVMLFLTTTSADLNDELQNRCLILAVDESREQTEAIHRLQRHKRTLDGLLARQRKSELFQLHHHVQRLLRPLQVVNPYADRLTFRADQTRTRRDHAKYLTLIDSIAFLHQYQRELKRVRHGDAELEYIEVQLSDIDAANRLAHDVLGRSLDELPPQTRRLLMLLCEWVATRCAALAIARTDFRFSRRDVRAATGWGDTQLRVHLERLLQLEYLLTHRGARGQSYEYELLYDGDGSERPHLSGLLDVTATTGSRGTGPGFAGEERGLSGTNAVGSRSTESAAQPSAARLGGEVQAFAVSAPLIRPHGAGAAAIVPLAASGVLQ